MRQIGLSFIIVALVSCSSSTDDSIGLRITTTSQTVASGHSVQFKIQNKDDQKFYISKCSDGHVKVQVASSDTGKYYDGGCSTAGGSSLALSHSESAYDSVFVSATSGKYKLHISFGAQLNQFDSELESNEFTIE